MTFTVLDTSAEAVQVQRAAYVAMGPENRVAQAFEMSDTVREIRLAGLRDRHPGESNSQLMQRLVRELPSTVG